MGDVIIGKQWSDLFDAVWPLVEPHARRVVDAPPTKQAEPLVQVCAVLGRALAIIMKGKRGSCEAVLKSLSDEVIRQAYSECAEIAREAKAAEHA